MVTNTLTSDTWHPSPQNSKHGIYSHLAPDRGSGGSWKPLPVLPGTPPLKTQPLGCPNALFQGFPLAPRSPHAAPPPPPNLHVPPRASVSVSSLCSIHLPSPISNQHHASPRSPSAHRPAPLRKSQRPFAGPPTPPPVLAPKPFPRRDRARTRYPAPRRYRAHRAGPSRSLPLGLAAALAGP